jgi:hypothetical protein
MDEGMAFTPERDSALGEMLERRKTIQSKIDRCQGNARQLRDEAAAQDAQARAYAQLASEYDRMIRVVSSPWGKAAEKLEAG